MSTVIAASALSNGLRTDFWRTYDAMNNRRADSRLSLIMDTTPMTNRTVTEQYWESVPDFEHWRAGETIPTDGFTGIQFTMSVYPWGRRVKWHKYDRKDDQTGRLYEQARSAGQSAALLPTDFVFDCINPSAVKLPAVPNAPDGAALYSTTDGGGSARFGATDGNLLQGTGVASESAITTDFYNALEQFKAFKDTKGLPLLLDDVVDQGALILAPSENLQAFESAFMRMRHGSVLGTDAGTTPSNLAQDAGRVPQIWTTSRLTGNDWYVFLPGAPQKPFSLLERDPPHEAAANEDLNSEITNSTGEEYIQWDLRSGIAVLLPYATIKINN